MCQDKQKRKVLRKLIHASCLPRASVNSIAPPASDPIDWVASLRTTFDVIFIEYDSTLLEGPGCGPAVREFVLQNQAMLKSTALVLVTNNALASDPQLQSSVFFTVPNFQISRTKALPEPHQRAVKPATIGHSMNWNVLKYVLRLRRRWRHRSSFVHILRNSAEEVQAHFQNVVRTHPCIILEREVKAASPTAEHHCMSTSKRGARRKRRANGGDRSRRAAAGGKATRGSSQTRARRQSTVALAKPSYRSEGSRTMYSNIMIETRQAISSDAEIIELVKLLWNSVVVATTNVGSKDALATGGAWEGDAPKAAPTVSKNAFVALMINYQLLLNAGDDIVELRKLAEADWERDTKRVPFSSATAMNAPPGSSQGAATNMDFVQFFCSVFELVDTWCPTAEQSDYAVMLACLIQFSQMTLDVQPDGLGIATHAWMAQQSGICELIGRVDDLHNMRGVKKSHKQVKALKRWLELRLARREGSPSGGDASKSKHSHQKRSRRQSVRGEVGTNKKNKNSRGQSLANPDRSGSVRVGDNGLLSAENADSAPAGGDALDEETLAHQLAGAMGDYFERSRKLSGIEGGTFELNSESDSDDSDDRMGFRGVASGSASESPRTSNVVDQSNSTLGTSSAEPRQRKHWVATGVTSVLDTVHAAGEHVPTQSFERAAGTTVAHKFVVGMRVRVFLDGKSWVNGTVQRCNADGSCDVQFDTEKRQDSNAIARSVHPRDLRALVESRSSSHKHWSKLRGILAFGGGVCAPMNLHANATLSVGRRGSALLARGLGRGTIQDGPARALNDVGASDDASSGRPRGGTVVAQKFVVGMAVQVLRDGRWCRGRVAKCHADGSCDVRFEADGLVIERLSAREVKKRIESDCSVGPAAPPFPVPDKSHRCWSKVRGMLAFGAQNKPSKHADGPDFSQRSAKTKTTSSTAVERSTLPGDVLVDRSSVPLKATRSVGGTVVAQKFNVGQRVQVLRDGAWAAGNVVKCHADGSCDILFDELVEGDSLDDLSSLLLTRVKPKHIKRRIDLSEGGAAAAAQSPPAASSKGHWSRLRGLVGSKKSQQRRALRIGAEVETGAIAATTPCDDKQRCPSVHRQALSQASIGATATHSDLASGHISRRSTGVAVPGCTDGLPGSLISSGASDSLNSVASRPSVQSTQHRKQSVTGSTIECGDRKSSHTAKTHRTIAFETQGLDLAEIKQSEDPVHQQQQQQHHHHHHHHHHHQQQQHHHHRQHHHSRRQCHNLATSQVPHGDGPTEQLQYLANPDSHDGHRRFSVAVSVELDLGLPRRSSREHLTNFEMHESKLPQGEIPRKDEFPVIVPGPVLSHVTFQPTVQTQQSPQHEQHIHHQTQTQTAQYPRRRRPTHVGGANERRRPSIATGASFDAEAVEHARRESLPVLRSKPQNIHEWQASQRSEYQLAKLSKPQKPADQCSRMARARRLTLNGGPLV